MSGSLAAFLGKNSMSLLGNSDPNDPNATGIRSVQKPQATGVGVPVGQIKEPSPIMNAGAPDPTKPTIPGSILGRMEDGSYLGGQKDGKILTPEEQYKSRTGRDLNPQNFQGTNAEKLKQAGKMGYDNPMRSGPREQENRLALRVAQSELKARMLKRGKASTYLSSALLPSSGSIFKSSLI